MEYDLHSRSHKGKTFSRTHRSSTKRTKGSQCNYRLAILEDKTRAEPAQRSEASAKVDCQDKNFRVQTQVRRPRLDKCASSLNYLGVLGMHVPRDVRVSGQEPSYVVR